MHFLYFKPSKLCVFSAVFPGDGEGLEQGLEGLLVQLLLHLHLGLVEEILVGLVELEAVGKAFDSGDQVLRVGGAGEEVGEDVCHLVLGDACLQEILVETHCRLVLCQLVLLAISSQHILQLGRADA